MRRFAIPLVVLTNPVVAQSSTPPLQGAITILNDEKSAAEQRALALYQELESTKAELATLHKRIDELTDENNKLKAEAHK